MTPNDEFIVQDILPSQEVHLIFGPIAEDCVLLSLSIYEEWSHSRPVFGFESHPAPAVFVSCARSDRVLRRGIKFMGMDPNKVPHVTLVGNSKPEDHNILTVLSFARRRDPKVKVIFIDGLLSLCGGRLNDHKESARFMREAVALCGKERVTIIGCVSASKAKEGSGYISTRDRMHGSSALQEASQAMILIEPNKISDDLNLGRSVTLFPPFGSPLKFQYSRETGPLAYIGDGPARDALDDWLFRYGRGGEVSSKELLQAATQVGVPRATLYRWIKDQLDLGRLSKSKHGIYIAADEWIS